MNEQAKNAYASFCGINFESGTPQEQRQWLAALQLAIKRAIYIVETYKVSVGNSPSGELAAEWTKQNLEEIRNELREMLP